MNCFSSGAVVRTGGSQSCIDGAPSVKYSSGIFTLLWSAFYGTYWSWCFGIHTDKAYGY